ncbi:MAG: hypothetical protein PHP90_05005 [Sulfuricurvum sp.]|uniref:hypothetical protein n=1 Tax=Sulfuricurvum sp. TaxID=2025608 RepID=UPI00260AC763|nr:hypothetical protein [Sulfuricurvum sp.]MDD5117930.1 hypothetical protein [Sulfuricurvum sp.]
MKKIFLPCLLINLAYADNALDITKVGNVITTATEYSDTLNKITLGAFGIMTHGEIEVRKGTMSMEGGFLGLNGKISDDVMTYTLKTEHQNTFIPHLNYGYKINWYDSKKINQALSTYNNVVTDINGNTYNALDIPTMQYRIRGLDADIGVGWNIIDLGPHDYFSFGADVGISTPWIESTQGSSSSNSGSSNVLATLYGFGDTKIWSYKVGPQMKVSKSLTSTLSLYGSAIYAYQYASLKNSSIGLKSFVDGTFTESELGLRYQPLEKKVPITRWLSLSPQLYFTAGVRYSKWALHDIAINLFDQNIPLPKSDMKVSSSTTYLGLGYSF